jgi:Rod binding domain-containing protein
MEIDLLKANSPSLAQTAPVEDMQKLKTKEAAKQFESLLVHQMLNAMTANTGKDELLGGSREQEFARDLYNQALAESIAEGRGIGIKEILERENLKNSNKLADESEI